jgi:type IV pilus assembly protein PilA
MKLKRLPGFTLIEILLVVALIALLAGIVIIAVNPSKQLADGRNARRRADVSTILNAVYQYSIDNNGLPTTIQENSDCSGTASNEICATGGDCTNLTDLSALTTNETYLPALPIDPSIGGTPNNTGYFINIDTDNRVTVCAPDAELGESISATR